MDNENQINDNFKKFKINPYKKFKGKRILKDYHTLLKNIYSKRKKLERKYQKIKQSGGSKEEVETQLSEISILHDKVKNLSLKEDGFIEFFKN